jgi:hypothetical protein
MALSVAGLLGLFPTERESEVTGRQTCFEEKSQEGKIKCLGELANALRAVLPLMSSFLPPF